MRRLTALAVAALAGAAPASTHAADVMTLPKDLVFGRSARAVQGADVPFRLPAGAKQGPRTWYLVRLHLRVEVSPQSGNGRLYVLGYTNGEACAQIRFDTRRTPSGLRVHSSELGLVAGARERTTSSLVHELTFRNFLLFGGVKGGANVLTVQVTQHEQARFESVRLFADSGIERSPFGPASITLEPLLDEDAAEAGRSFRVHYRVRNPGARAAANGVVRAEPSDGLIVLSRKEARFPRVPARGSVEGEFELEAAEPGRYELQLAAESVSGSPVARLAVTVREASSPRWQWTAAALGAAAAALVAAGVALRRRPLLAAAGAAIYVAALVVYTYAGSGGVAVAVLLAGSVAAGFAAGGWWALALPLLWPLLALVSADEREVGWIAALALAPLGAIPIAVGVALERVLPIASLGRKAY